MDVFFLILIVGAQIAAAWYLITQTTGNGVPPSAKSARTKAIIGACVPMYGIPFLAYFYWKYQSAVSAADRMGPLPTSFGATTPSRPPIESGESAAQGQQKNNPFL